MELVCCCSNQGGIKSALKGKMAEKVTKRVMNILEAVGSIPPPSDHANRYLYSLLIKKPLAHPSQIGLEPPVLLATNKDDNRKPETGMWQFFVEHGNKGVEPGKQPGHRFLSSTQLDRAAELMSSRLYVHHLSSSCKVDRPLAVKKQL